MISAQLAQAAIPEVLETQPRAFDQFFLCDIGGLLQRARELGMREASVEYLDRGQPELTEEVEKHMRKFEQDIFVGRGWNNVDDVVGSVPNVPAFMAGHPQCMRRRQRASSASGPLVVFFELTGSSGAMTGRGRRGAAMLALVQLLANTRPVEFWTLTTYGRLNVMNMVACKMDTSPLDVARSAAMLCDYNTLKIITEVKNRALGGMGDSWSYGSPHMERTWSGEALRRVISASAELLFIPAAWLGDIGVNDANAEKWIRDMLAKYGMGAVQREDD